VFQRSGLAQADRGRYLTDSNGAASPKPAVVDIWPIRAPAPRLSRPWSISDRFGRPRPAWRTVIDIWRVRTGRLRL